MTAFAMIFPGQGSQKLGMLKEMAKAYPSILESFHQASEVLTYDLWQLVQQDECRLNQTACTQSAMLTADVALWQLWKQQGGSDPVVMAGHSLGEYSALVCAGCLDFTDAVSLVAERGRLMQEAVPEGQGAMAAIIGLSEDKVQVICDTAAAGECVVPANMNAPGQIVISGDKSAVQRAIDLAIDQEAKMAKVLAVSVPSHSPLMQIAAEQFAKQLQSITMHLPQISVIQNVHVHHYATVDKIQKALIEQMYSAVQWVRTIESMKNDWHAAFTVECGPGRVLKGLQKRIDKSLPCYSLSNESGLTALLQGQAG